MHQGKRGAQEHYIFITCNGIQKSHHGYVWRFELDEFEKYPLPKNPLAKVLKKSKLRKQQKTTEIKAKKKQCKTLKIYKYALDGTLIDIYDNVYSSSNITINDIKYIILCAKKKQKTYKGYIYRFERDLYLEEKGYRNSKSNTIKIKQYDLYGNYIKTFDSISIAEEQTSATNISQCALGKRHQSGGYVWRYENDSFDKFPIERKPTTIRKKYNIPIYEFDFSGKLLQRYDSLYSFPKRQQSNIVKCLNNEISYVKNKIYSYESVLNYDKLKNIKRIAQYSLDGKLIKIYDSVKEARLQSGATKISDCLNNHIKSSGGYKWEYILHQK